MEDTMRDCEFCECRHLRSSADACYRIASKQLIAERTKREEAEDTWRALREERVRLLGLVDEATAKREEAERQRDELRACIDNYDQMTRAAATQASDADARSSKAERELAAERARSAALQADIASWIRRGSTEDGTELSRYFHHHLAMGEQEGVELANAIESGAWRNALSQPAPTEKKT